jgi:hypothetical protein
MILVLIGLLIGISDDSTVVIILGMPVTWFFEIISKINNIFLNMFPKELPTFISIFSFLIIIIILPLSLLLFISTKIFCKGIKHLWDGCTCNRCGLTRNEHHDWNGCTCNRCNIKREVPEEQHLWNGCKCERCNIKREVSEEQHLWKGCKCERCGSTRDAYNEHDDLHDWDFYNINIYTPVGQPTGHNWESTIDETGYECKRCGIKKDVHRNG